MRAAGAAFVVDAVRRCAVGFAPCAWLPGVALSGFERAFARLRGVAGCTCSFASGVSDVFLMKKTPFYLTIRHGACCNAQREALCALVASRGGNLSSQPQKRTAIFPYGKRQTLSLVQCQALYSSALTGVVAMVNRS